MQIKNFFYNLTFYLKPHTAKLIFTAVMIMLATLLETSIPEIAGRIVDELFINQRNQKTALIYALVLFVIILMSSLFAISATAASSWVSNKVISDLRIDMFAKLLRLPKAYFDKNPSGVILSKLTFNVEQISNVISVMWLDFLKSFVAVIFLISYLFYKNFQLSLVIFILLPLIYIAVKLSSKLIRKSSKKVQKSMGYITHLLNENVAGNSIIKIHNAQQQEAHKFNNFIKNIRSQKFKVDMATAFNTGFVNILIGGALGFVVYLSSTNLAMSAGQFLSFFAAMSMLVKPSKNLINMNKQLQSAIAAEKAVSKLLKEKEEINNGTKILKELKGVIKFNNVSFSYFDKKPVLNNINLTINAGQTIALVGSTGSGKTTIIQLLAKFYLITDGLITIDDIDINEIETNSLRSKISFVEQNIRLFNDTIRDNIALGKTNTINDDQIINAAKAANAEHFIDQLDNKFYTEIGEDGVKLSGGQRQRLAIARAIAKNSDILILDEATSALDSTTENKVQQAIDNLQENKTTIIIAHRLSTIKKADKIIVLDKGCIVEEGTHQELIAKNKEYKKLYKNQFKD
jgi:subfamily B ATP-binding cassette protein MsbA